MKTLRLILALFLFTPAPCLFAQHNAALSRQLVESATQIFAIERTLPDAYAKTFSEYGDAGDGLQSVLYNDVLYILNLALIQDSTNCDAFYWQAKVLRNKASLGEGDFDLPMLKKGLAAFSKYVRYKPLSGQASALKEEIEAIVKDIEHRRK